MCFTIGNSIRRFTFDHIKYNRQYDIVYWIVRWSPEGTRTLDHLVLGHARFVGMEEAPAGVVHSRESWGAGGGPRCPGVLSVFSPFFQMEAMG